jgi:DNA-binding NarL/FixJ family response regulator
MKFSQSYVLILAQPSDDLQMLESLLERLKCPSIVTHSPEQALAQANQDPPYLMIFAGSHPKWLQMRVNDLRSNLANAGSITIVALTDFHVPKWLHQEDNPGFDGFLVKPLSSDVLTSLLQSAWARQTCYMTG